MSWLGIAGALAFFGTSAATVTETEIVAAAEEAASEIIMLEQERYRRMTVPVMINGQGPFDFMIDTGAQATVMSNALADMLQLTERDTATLVGMASSRMVETTTVPHLSFGSSERFDARAALVDGSNIGGADGILGIDSLRDQRVLLDFENLIMEVGESTGGAQNRGYDIVVRARRIGEQLIIARARIDGVRTAVVVDTGAQGSIGNGALFDRLRRRQGSVETEMTDINGVQASGVTRVARTLELDRAQLSNFHIAFADSPLFAALDLEDEPAMILGMNELRLFERVAIDFASRRVLFDLPEGSRLPTLRSFGTSGRFSDR